MTESPEADIQHRLAAYITARSPQDGQARVEGLERIHGGASRETYRFRLIRQTPQGETPPRRLILRRDPPGKTLVASQREVEFAAYRAVHGTAVPVPEMLWLEEDPSHLDQPFFVAEEVAGFEVQGRLFSIAPFKDVREQIGRAKWTILGELARLDPKARKLVGPMPDVAPDQCWRRELDHWEAILDADEIAPQPICRAAIRHMRRNPPPPASRIALVHGDYRTGNFLFGADGGVHAILDWEMAHLGDPLEDLAWSLSRTWCFGRNDLRGGLLPKAEAIAIWEQASGLKADPDALTWWELFSVVKGQAIWASSAKAWASGETPELMLALTAWAMVNSHDRAALELMGRL